MFGVGWTLFGAVLGYVSGRIGHVSSGLGICLERLAVLWRRTRAHTPCLVSRLFARQLSRATLEA
jgi:hypothetical protein